MSIPDLFQVLFVSCSSNAEITFRFHKENAWYFLVVIATIFFEKFILYFRVILIIKATSENIIDVIINIASYVNTH